MDWGFQLGPNDDFVVDLLSQFDAASAQAQAEQPAAESSHNSQSTGSRVQPVNELQETLQLAVTIEDGQPSGLKLAAVEIPAVVNGEEYKNLPGHSAVRYIISEEQDDDGDIVYKVRMRSSELQIVNLTQLQNLQNGPEALERFESSDQDSQITIPSDEDYDSTESHLVNARRSMRATKPRRRLTGFFAGVNSYDDGGIMSSSSDDVIVSSAATSRARWSRGDVRQKGSRQNTRQSSRISDYFDKPRSKGTRFSTRDRRTVRSNLRERFEDDISENEIRAKQKKYVGAKEAFHTVPRHDPFRLCHLNTCDVCGISGNDNEKGPLVFCQGCTFSYHQVCLGPRGNRDHLVTKIADDNFVLQCRHCLGVVHAKDRLSPHLGHCNACNDEGPLSKPLRERLSPKQEQQLRQENGGKDPIISIDMARINNVENLLFRCSGCRRAYHLDHLPPLSDDDGDNVAVSRFQQYSSHWQCLDCISAPDEIAAMVAWRPVQPDLVDRAASKLSEDKKEYLIRWRDKSYHHTTWMPGTWVWGVAKHAMRRAFLKSDKDINPQELAEEAVPEDFLRIDIVFDVRYSEKPQDRSEEVDIARIDDVKEAYVKFKGLPYEESVWETPPEPNSERWADFKEAYEDWVRRDYIQTLSQDALRKHLSYVRKQNFKTTVVRDTQPESMTGGEIMEYQKDGLNWLYYMWFKQQNAILADEMGLGKTIQVISFFATLIQYHKCWPFLVVVPNSTCSNWRKEIKKWVPSIRVVTYYGSAFSRKLAQDYEMFGKEGSDLRCHVVVTSYETMVDENSRKMLSRIPWAGLVVDEGQRLKNDRSLLYESLFKIEFPFKVLLTGTPLQNNTRELFNLLQFCDPSIKAEDMEAEYGVLSKDNIPQLHEMIRPFFLRRTKAQVLNFLPPIANIIVPVSMSVVQKKLYKSILAKNPQLIETIFQRKGDQTGLKQVERKNLNNILLQLRKCLCHPFLYSKAIEERTPDITASHRHLVEAAGKLRLLHLMLPKLQQRGHRVLIFSQFLEHLDIIEDFLDGLGMLYRRLDGRMPAMEKQKRIDEYNAEGSPYFVFLLSTRSGGVGINLATADTVIIMDPDFNPHQDMQASSRAHRIGQKNKVLVFQLMTRGSAEEKIMQIGKKKMVLDHVLIDRMIAEEDDGRDLESILRHGAQALFDDDDSGDIHYDSESVDKLLDRSQVEQTKMPDANSTEDPFSFARVWANDNQNLNGQLDDAVDEGPVNPSVWEKILREREQAAEEESKGKAENLGRGKRKRTAVDYSHAAEVSPAKPRRQDDDSDIEFQAGNLDVPESDLDSGPGMMSDDLDSPTKRTKVAPFKRVDLPDLEPPSAPAPVTENTLVCYACNRSHPPGQCRLKSAGVEHCPLCGLAHYGVRRTCPHFQSEVQLSRMLEALKNSTEEREIRNLARIYVGGIKGDLARRRRSLNPNQTPTPGCKPAALGALDDQKKNSIHGTAALSPVLGGPTPGPGPGVGPGPPSAIDLIGHSETNNTGIGSVSNNPSWRTSFKTWLNGHG